MRFFLSRYLNKIDQKGRVSVPASYRNILFKTENKFDLIIYPSTKYDCIECCSLDYLDNLVHMANKMNDSFEEKIAFETVIFGSALHLMIDKDGRVIIPNKFLVRFNLKNNVEFIGKGEIFEIWNPNLLQKHVADAEEKVKKKMLRF